MIKYACMTLVTAFLIAQASMTLGARPTSDEASIREWQQRNLEHFQTHLSACPENQIRCLWFLRNDVRIGMVMTIDLRKRTVYTVRYCFDHARQCEKTRQLNPYQIDAARELLPELPARAPEVDFAEGLHLAFWLENELHIVTYDKSAVTLVVRRLYDIGGGPRDFITERP